MRVPKSFTTVGVSENLQFKDSKVFYYSGGPFGVPGGPCGSVWVCGVRGGPWASVGVCGRPWAFMGVRGRPWAFMGVHGRQMNALGASGRKIVAATY